jgi:hypothetical protein
VTRPQKRPKDVPISKPAIWLKNSSALATKQIAHCISGYKADCPLYKKSNGEYLNEERFNAAVDELIDKTKAKHAKISR